MPNQLEATYTKLIQLASTLPGVQSIGRSGGGALPQSPAEGDIDVFLYCDIIPSQEARKAILDSMCNELDIMQVSVFSGGRWGDGDFARIGGVETWLMYFTLEQAAAEVDAVLRGEQPDREGTYFYPTGRCAMYLGMEVLLDRGGFLREMKERLAVYPEMLADKLLEHHLAALDDTEDLERAVARKDPLFYHFALDISLDHFLQALFALNRVFFPSRKRSLEHIASFKAKPADCEKRILDVIRLGGTAEGIGQSYGIWTDLVKELKQLAE